MIRREPYYINLRIYPFIDSCKLVFCLFAMCLSSNIALGASFFTNDLHELTIGGDIDLIHKYSELDNDECYNDTQFQTFDLGIESKYFNHPDSFIHTKMVLDFSDELISKNLPECLGGNDNNTNTERDIVEELRIGYAWKNLEGSVGKIPAYAETIDISESYDSSSFTAFDDEALTQFQQSNDIILRGEWILEKFNIIADWNPSVDTDDAEEDILNAGLTIETLIPGTSAIFTIGYKDSYSLLFGEDVTIIGFSIEDIFYERRIESNIALDIAYAESDLGDYVNQSFSYYLENYGKVSLGADLFYASSEEFKKFGQEGKDRSLYYLNYSHAFYKYYKIFAEINRFESGDSDIESVLVGIGSNF